MKQKRALLSQTAIDSLVHFSWHPHRGQTNEVGQDIGHFCVFVSWKGTLMPSHLEWGDCGRWANAPNWFLFSLFYFMRYDHQGLWLVTTSYISDCPQPIVKDQGKISSLGTMWNHSHSRKSLIYPVLKIFIFFLVSYSWDQFFCSRHFPNEMLWRFCELCLKKFQFCQWFFQDF